MAHSDPIIDISGVDPPTFDEGMSAALILATEIGWLQRKVVAKLDGRRPASMLDAGCGSQRPFGLLADTVVGIDSDLESLERNRSLTEAIHADFANVELGLESYEVIICWNVLEHVDDPAALIGRFARALISKGLLVLAFSNAGSVRGQITRLTPTAVHQTILRYVLEGRTNVPYPTRLTRNHRPTRILEIAQQESLMPLHVRLYEGYYERRLREVRPTIYKIWATGVRSIERLTQGRLDSRSDVLMAFEKSEKKVE